jgi:acetyl/propionyl-CoA carboxylase alpha subunit
VTVTQHVKDADIAIALDGLKPSDTYLSIEKLIQAAQKTGLKLFSRLWLFIRKC